MKFIIYLLFLLPISILSAENIININEPCLCAGSGTGVADSDIKAEMIFLLKEKHSYSKLYRLYNKLDRRKRGFSTVDVANMFCIDPYLDTKKLATKRELVKLIQREIEKTESQ